VFPFRSAADFLIPTTATIGDQLVEVPSEVAEVPSDVVEVQGYSPSELSLGRLDQVDRRMSLPHYQRLNFSLCATNGRASSRVVLSTCVKIINDCRLAGPWCAALFPADMGPVRAHGAI
jgi:hypothetical protein